MILNYLLFFPFGFGLAGVLLDRIKFKNRAIFIVLLGFVISLLIATIQYLFKLGYTETDDLIFNVLGCIVATIALFISEKFIN